MPEVRLEIPARPEYLLVARQVVAAAAGLADAVRDERLEDLRVAVSEATTNAVEAHRDYGSGERIVLVCNLDDDRIEVEVVDQGGGFDVAEAATAPAPDAPDRLDWEGGLGLAIMRELTDEAEIEPIPDGTAVRLTVYAPGAAPDTSPPAHDADAHDADAADADASDAQPEPD